MLYGKIIFLFFLIYIQESTMLVPPYVKQCYEGDPNLIECFKNSIHHLRPYLFTGIADIDVPSLEPLVINNISLSITTTPNGYQIILKDMDVFGVSNFTVSQLKLGRNKTLFETVLNIPLMRMNSRYKSRGVLIIIPAGGNGTVTVQLMNSKVYIKGKVDIDRRNKLNYLHIKNVNLELNAKHINISVRNSYSNDKILSEALNLFLRENGNEVFNLMRPQLQKQLSNIIVDIINKYFANVPVDELYVPLSKQI